MENKTKRDLLLYNLVSDFELMISTGNINYLEEKKYQELIHYYEEESQFDKALEVLDHALRQFQFRSDFYIAKSRILFKQHNYAESLVILDQAETIAPFEFEIRILRAKILAAQGEFDQAYNILEDLKTYATPSDKIELHICESIVHEWANEYDAMFQSLKKALMIDPKNEIALERIWISTGLSKNFEESLLLHEIILEEYPYNYLAWYNLGHAKACVGEYESAVDALEYSFLIQKDFELGYLDCAELCFQLCRYEQALQIYSEANKNFGPDPELLVNIAQCQFNISQMIDAKINVKKAIKLDPYNDEAHFLLAQCYMQDENWNKALKYLNKAVDLDDYREEYFHALARCYMSLGEFKKTRYYYRKAAKAGLEQPIYWEEYISFLIKIQDFKEAEKVLKQAEVHTYSEKLLYCKSILHLKRGNRNFALSCLEEALNENPDTYKFFFDLAPEYATDKQLVSLVNYFKEEYKYL
ncbi:MAG: tetratricopeptide repeat protein [Melioribacteraceae bacterium]|nr:tetratricopeptide repeat protein [Melioribacteraceae bacterium]